MSNQSLALYIIKGKKELMVSHPGGVDPEIADLVLPACSSSYALWAALPSIPGWSEHAPGYQGTFPFGGGTYIGAQFSDGQVTFALSFGEGFLHDQDDISSARQTLANFQTLLHYAESVPGAHHNESNDEGDGHE